MAVFLGEPGYCSSGQRCPNTAASEEHDEHADFGEDRQPGSTEQGSGGYNHGAERFHRDPAGLEGYRWLVAR